jgi:glycosyltransferase involved in cell wall biosynthesis
VKLTFVVQRYGLEVTGGAERHCRSLAERLAARHQVRVLTTCALDYTEWRNHYPPGSAVVEGVPVTRFPVSRPRSAREFGLISDLVFLDDHDLEDERRWVVENGPFCPELLRALDGEAEADLLVFYCFRYYQTFFGLPRVRERSVLVPTAEEDPAVRLPVFKALFAAPRGILYLTPEERELVQGVSGNQRVPEAVIGGGIDVPEGWEELEIRGRFGLPGRYLLYLGRIDRNKGADRLLQYYEWLVEEWPEVPDLVLVGYPALPLPEHPKVRHLGTVSEAEKFALLAGCELLLMPSPYESLSLVLLEAWATGRPALVNGSCEVLRGQAVRSGGAVFYRDFAEFAECLRVLLGDPHLLARLGAQGREYVGREYAWPVVEARTERLLTSLLGERPA